MGKQTAIVCGLRDGTNIIVPLKVSATGALYMIETVDALNDIGDVDLAGLADVYIIYYDDASSTWKCMAIPAAAWADITGKPTAPSLEEMAAEHEDDGTHGDITPSSCTEKYTDADAVGAMGVLGDANPLHHDRATEWGAAEHTAIGDGAPHHAKYTDANAVTAMGAKADDNPLHHDRAAEWGAAEHTAIGDGAPHHALYVHPGVVQCDAITTCDKHTKVLHDALGLSHDSLADVSKDDHHNEDHAARHKVGGADILYVPRTYVWFVPGDVATGTEQGPTFRMKRDTIIEDVELHVKTAPTGAALIVDILEAGTTVFTTKPEIDIAGTTEDDNHVFSDTALAAAAELRMDITQVGSTVAGKDLTVLLHCKEPVI